ncbi:hypothetical protein B0H17DRAFT_1083208 [Mycena rosella]|uniref:Uncharacterized protein n=1 Tax=Mycena rosella TaxID=1033263 RepID=A0AAD7G756_MYCRO|nr:hypothetical protein B0H17DRAFT_1083208 [Mycena rosella]
MILIPWYLHLMSAIPLLNANLAAAVLESLLYGIYALLSLFTVYLMVTRHRESLKIRSAVAHSRFYSPLAFWTFSLLAIVTGHWLLTVLRLFLAFKNWEDGPGPRIFYSNLSQSTEVLKYAFLVAALLIGDGFLIHRLWVLWDFRTRIIIFPTITLLGLLGFGVGLTYQLSTYTANDSIFESAFRRWSTGVCFFSMVTILYTVGFVWYRLWDMGRVLRSFGMETPNTILRILIDSAALVAVPGLFHVISYQCGSDLQVIGIDCTPPMLGISNLLIQIRLHWNLAEQRAASGATENIKFATVTGKSQGDVNLESRSAC